jgi:hypothetical protein
MRLMAASPTATTGAPRTPVTVTGPDWSGLKPIHLGLCLE